MPQPPMGNVVAHWHKLIGDFQTSPKDFYTAVEAALDRQKVPGLSTSRVDWHEGGILSPEREYLRVTGDRHFFDMCAAPFGTDFFFSSWVTKRKARFVLLAFALLVAATLLLNWFVRMALTRVWKVPFGIAAFLWWNPGPGLIVMPLVVFPVVLWLVALTARAGRADLELAVLAMPLIGAFYKVLFAPDTYYRLDTMLMFHSVVHSSMMEVIDGLTTQKGVRGLSDDDRKPVFYKLT